MASAPATPKALGTPSTSPTGTWRHPRLDEINQRVRARTFNENNIQKIIWNAATIVATFVIPHLLKRFMPAIFWLLPYPGQYGLWAIWTVRIWFVYNIAMAFSPLYAKPDDLSDIPLTPSQRSLLGLPASSTPLTPGTQYITPPRYSRSTPRAGNASISSGVRAQAGTVPRSPNSSPLAGRGRESASHSPSPYARGSSPLLQRKSGNDLQRRLSYGSLFPLAVSSYMESTTSLAASTSSAPSTPTPASARQNASVGLNNKWLYQNRDRMSPSGRSPFS